MFLKETYSSEEELLAEEALPKPSVGCEQDKPRPDNCGEVQSALVKARKLLP
jgi:hypothetical protein